MCCNNRRSISVGLLVLFGVLFGVAFALIWVFGLAVFIRDTIPYALAFAVILLITTVILRAICGNYHRERHEEFHLSPTCCSLIKYSPLVFISAAVCIIGSLIFLATDWVVAWKTVLAFVNSISFGILISGFFGMILSMSYRRR